MAKDKKVKDEKVEQFLKALKEANDKLKERTDKK